MPRVERGSTLEDLVPSKPRVLMPLMTGKSPEETRVRDEMRKLLDKTLEVLQTTCPK